MVEWQQLPIEILEQLLWHVDSNSNDKTNMFECIRVCKNWKHSSQKLAYNKVTLLKKEQLEKLKRVLRNNETLGKLVKILNYDFRLLDSDLEILSNLLPFLEHLENIDPHLEEEKYFYEKLSALHKQSKFTRLRSFPHSYYYSLENIESYVKCAFEYRSTLSKLQIPETRCLENTNIPSVNIAAIGCYFPCLTELYFRRDYTYDDEQLAIESFDTIVDSCTNLKKLTYYDVQVDEGGNNPRDLLAIKQHQTVESLELKGIPFVTVCEKLPYLKHKFPALSRFIVEYDSIGEDILDSQTMDLLIYVSDLDEYKLNFICFIDNDERTLLSQFWALPGNCKNKKRLWISFHEEWLEEADKEKTLYLWKTTNIPISHFSISYGCNESNNFQLGAIEDLLRENGEKVQHLEIGSSDAPNNFPNLLTIELFKLTFEYCKNLDSLEVFGIRIPLLAYGR